MANEIQNDDMYLPGDLGSVNINGDNHQVKKIVQNKIDKSTTVTVNPIDKVEDLKDYLIKKDGSLISWEDWEKEPVDGVSKTEDADFEIIKTLNQK